MKKEKYTIDKLKFYIKPQIDFLFLLFGENYRKNAGVICENFMQISCAENLYENPWVEFANLYRLDQIYTIDTYKLPNDLLDPDNFIYVLKKCVDSGFLVMFLIDTYYINSYINYHTRHFQHEIIVNGYSGNKFTVIDYFDYLHLASTTVDQEELCAGYINYHKLMNEYNYFDYIRGLQLGRPNEHVGNQVDIDIILFGLQTLLKPEDRRVHISQKSGFDVFKKIVEYIDSLKEDENIDIRILHFWVVHAVIMKYRMELIVNSNKQIFKNFNDNINDIILKAQLCKNLAIYYNLNKTEKKEVAKKKIIKNILELNLAYYNIIKKFDNILYCNQQEINTFLN